jgi:nucleotide-binding universal stress UspA family protein
MLDQVVVESGHRVDSPNRAEPRFPPEAEGRVKAALAGVLDRWGVGPGSVVLTQGARGADILVAELARDRGADVRMLLALPSREFVRRSVELPRSTWARRFAELMAAFPPEVLDPPSLGDEPFARNNERVLDEAAALAETHGVPLRAVVVWDGQAEEGPGGTAEFLRAARARDADVVVAEPRATWRTGNVPYWERQRAAGPKRLLALDGGGVRGIITLELLHEMERVLGEGDESFVLADYFDYVAGTSTGAVIATALALGHRVATIQERYRTRRRRSSSVAGCRGGSARSTRTAR